MNPKQLNHIIRLANRLAAPRRAAEPRRHCRGCNGLGAQPFFDVDTRWNYERCLKCDGRATAGTYIARLHVGKVRIEQSWECRDFARALAVVTRWAGIVALTLPHCRGRAEVVLSFVSFEGRERAEEVAAVAIRPEGPRRAA